MRVLFVDDEKAILEGLERALFHLSDTWEMEFALGAAAALRALDEEPFQVIVTDMRMPGMDGADLLREVYRRHPNVVRIVLSGHADAEAALRAVGVAHQFLSKPCKPEVLEETVARACALHGVLSHPSVKDVLGQVQTLPSVPKIYSALVAALADPDVDADDIAGIVSQDPAMSAKVLQLVNSSFFGLARTVTDVRHAALMLGFQTVRDLVLTAEVFESDAPVPRAAGFSITDLQHHAVLTANLTRSMFDNKTVAADAFTAGLLHDVGKLVLAAQLPDVLTAAIGHARAHGVDLYQAEQALMGVTHAELGGYLMGLWGLPYSIVDAVTNHHHPMRPPPRDIFGITEAVYVANALIHDDPVDEAVITHFALDDKVKAWTEQARALKEGAGHG